MNIKYTNLCRIFFLLSDLCALSMVYLLLLSGFPLMAGMGNKNYVVLYLVSNMTWLVCSYLSGSYLIYKNIDPKKISKRTAIAFLVFCTVVMFFIFMYGYHYNRVFVMLTLTGFGAFLFLTRAVMTGLIYYIRTNPRFECKVVMIGYNDISKDLSASFSTNHKKISIMGYFNDKDSGPLGGVYPFLGKMGDCLNYAIENNVSEIYCSLSPESHIDLYQMAEEAEKNFIRFRFIPDLRKFIDRKVHIDFIEHMPILSLRREPLEYNTAQVKKRFFDIMISSIIIIFILSWLLPILALIIKLDSKGPVFFPQRRSGKNNRPFTCLKLRSLRVYNDEDLAAKQVTQDDNRITRVGRILRKTNLDELPQFINVFLGQMSIVGARPHMLRHTIDFAIIEDSYMVRHLSKPGVTGWAQINGYRGEIKQQAQLKRRIEHDIWYIENWNIWLDIRIIFLTVYLMIKGDKNAY